MKKENQIKLIIGLNILFAALTIITDALYINLGNPYVFKTIASLTFVIWSLLNLILMFTFKHTLNKKFMVFMFIVQILACLGDIFLIFNFILGAVFFALGHILFFVAYLFLQKFKPFDLLFILGAIAISLIIIFVSNVNLGSYTPLVLIYAIIISTMLGKSTTIFKGNKLIASVIFIGSLLFYLSDMFLMFNVFGGVGRVASILCLAFYYPAEFVLASSIGIVGIVSAIKNK